MAKFKQIFERRKTNHGKLNQFVKKLERSANKQYSKDRYVILNLEEEKNLLTKDHLELMKKYDYLVKDHE